MRLASWIAIWLRRHGFGRGALRRRSDRAEVAVLVATVILAVAAVPVGAKVEDMTYTRLSAVPAPADQALIHEQASAIGFIAVLLWMLLVVVAHRLAGWALERRRLVSWGREWERVSPQ